LRPDAFVREPSGPITLRFGEKGMIWIKFTVRTPGAHGSYTHLSPSATKIAVKLISDLEQVTEIPTPATPQIEKALSEGIDGIERALGNGASKTLQRDTALGN
jgi:succinyl-diaminopimelate desuccinylase